MKLFVVQFAPLLLFQMAAVQSAEVEVQLDTSEVPELAEWGERGKALIEEWYPRLSNLLSSPGFEPPSEMKLVLKKSDKGVGATAGRKIVIFSNWIEKHPDEFGLLIHELVHVIQQYQGAGPVWVTEGIADYLRWAIYEGKPLVKFPRPKAEEGYKRGYQPAAGFLFWLETNDAPGIVRRLNSAMRAGNYSPAVFEEATGRSLNLLWQDYLIASSS